MARQLIARLSLQRTCAWFPAPPWTLTIIFCNSSPREFHVLL
ncbi:rCG28482 [Rattus norvegicus]|uniref:RCG28482 n=1 Tax=Rattus norvegicus TaxID=10116 RepID=A6HWB3_RAT|nr:rCG28482 [Rattus norvegicus]